MFEPLDSDLFCLRSFCGNVATQVITKADGDAECYCSEHMGPRLMTLAAYGFPVTVQAINHAGE